MHFFFRAVISIALIIIVASTALGEPSLDDVLPEGFSEEEKTALLKSSYIYRYDKKFDGVKYAPRVPSASGLIAAYEKVEPQVFIEVLALMPEIQDVSPEELPLLTYNSLRQVSSISGVHYVSSHDGQEKELFSDVFRVEEAGRGKPLDDDLVDSIPPRESLIVHMKEANMGRGYYAFDYSYDGSNIALTIRNLSTMRKIFKILEPGGLEFRFLFVPVEDQILLYVNCAVHMENEAMVRKMFTPWGYFHSRIKILYAWLYRRLLGSDAVPLMPE